MDNVSALFSRGGTFVVDGRTISRGELDSAARRVVGYLEQAGTGPGDRIGLRMPNTPGYLACLWACARLGAVAVALNHRFSRPELDDLTRRAGCRLIVSDTEGGSVPVVHPTEVTAGPLSTTDRSAPQAPFAVFTTSGTTSEPKLVLHTQGGVAAHGADAARAFGYGPGTVSLLALPLSGVFGFTTLTAALAAGSTTVVQARPHAQTGAALIERYGVTHCCASDDFLTRVLDTGADLSSLRYVGYAAFNPALDDLPVRAEARGIPMCGLYGMSEVQALFAGRDPHQPLAERRRTGGRPASPEASARVVDADSGKPLPPGGEGELQLRGPSMFAGYLADGGAHLDHELTAGHFTDGWFRTGDLGRMEDGGSFEYLARMGDVLRLGGYLVNPAEIEQPLLGHPGVADVQVVAIDRPTGARAVAFVLADPTEFDEEALVEFCRARMARYKVPLRIVRLDEFPTTPSANGTKIRKADLRAMADSVVTADS